jgi:hypothetical protein
MLLLKNAILKKSPYFTSLIINSSRLVFLPPKRLNPKEEISHIQILDSANRKSTLISQKSKGQQTAPLEKDIETRIAETQSEINRLGNSTNPAAKDLAQGLKKQLAAYKLILTDLKTIKTTASPKDIPGLVKWAGKIFQEAESAVINEQDSPFDNNYANTIIKKIQGRTTASNIHRVIPELPFYFDVQLSSNEKAQIHAAFNSFISTPSGKELIQKLRGSNFKTFLTIQNLRGDSGANNSILNIQGQLIGQISFNRQHFSRLEPIKKTEFLANELFDQWGWLLAHQSGSSNSNVSQVATSQFQMLGIVFNERVRRELAGERKMTPLELEETYRQFSGFYPHRLRAYSTWYKPITNPVTLKQMNEATVLATNGTFSSSKSFHHYFLSVGDL